MDKLGRWVLPIGAVYPRKSPAVERVHFVREGTWAELCADEDIKPLAAKSAQLFVSLALFTVSKRVPDVMWDRKLDLQLGEGNSPKHSWRVSDCGASRR